MRNADQNGGNKTWKTLKKAEKTLEIQGCLCYTVPMTANVHFYSIKNRIPKQDLEVFSKFVR